MGVDVMEKLIDAAKKVIINLINEAEKAELERHKKENEKSKIEIERELEEKIDAIKDSIGLGYEHIKDSLDDFDSTYSEWHEINIEEKIIKDRWKKVRKEFGCLT